MRIPIVRLLFVLISLSAFSTVFAQGTAFTYQGRLNDGANPAAGNYDLRFIIYDNNPGGSQQGPILTNSATVVTNGLFTVTLDFGSGIFPGGGRWLEIAVRTNGAGGFTTLSPRQPLTATPYAITASNLSGTLPVGQLSGTLSSGQLGGTYSGAVTLNNAGNSFSGNGSGLTSVNATTLGGIASSNFWQLDGNNVSSGQFLGSTNSQALELQVNSVRGLRLEPNASHSPNLIGGSPANYVGTGVVGAVISGGGSTNIAGNAYSNVVLASYANIGGGVGNTVDAGASITTIGGGVQNEIQYGAPESIIGGGGGNLIQTNSDSSTIGGGQNNGIHLNSWGSTIAGGENNHVYESAHESAIGGGNQNFINSNSVQSVIGGGNQNTILNDAGNSTISGGQNQSIGAGSASATIAGGGQNVINSNSPQATISGGLVNRVGNDAVNSTIGGGGQNIIMDGAYDSVIGGGEQNVIQTNSGTSTIGGGVANVVQTNSIGSVIGGGSVNIILPNNSYSTIAGGSGNTNTGAYAAIPGGSFNAAGQESFAAGHRAKATTTGAFVWADSTEADFVATANNQFLVRAANGVGINTNNPQSALHVNGTIIATSFAGGGAGLTSLPASVVTNNASNVTLGGTFSGNGSGLTNLNATKISSGNLADARLSGNVPFLNGNQFFSGTNVFNAPVGINTNSPKATLDVNGSLRVGNGTTVFNNLQAGIAQMATDSSTEKTNFTFSFPRAFSTVPNIIVSGRADPGQNVDDTFAVSVRTATTTNCTVNITRTDTAAGWGQHVQVTWLAWE